MTNAQAYGLKYGDLVDMDGLQITVDRTTTVHPHQKARIPADHRLTHRLDDGTLVSAFVSQCQLVKKQKGTH